MSGPEYRTIRWNVDHSGTDAITLIENLLADGWQLHGGLTAISGARVLQALVKPPSNDAPRVPVPTEDYALMRGPAMDAALKAIGERSADTAVVKALAALYLAAFRAGVIAAGGKA